MFVWGRGFCVGDTIIPVASNSQYMDVCFVYISKGEQVAHPVHQHWAKSVGADSMILSKPKFPGPLPDSVLADLCLDTATLSTRGSYDVYVFEAPGTVYALPEFEKHDPDAAKIFLNTTWRLEGLPAYDWKSWGFVKQMVGGIDRTLDKHLLRTYMRRYLDGVVAVSELTRERVQFLDVPVSLIHPHISDDIVPALTSVTPSFENPTAVTVCENRGHKGTDLLVDAWETVVDAVPNATLRILGSGHPPAYEATPGVQVAGFVDSLPREFNNTAVAIHPARFDAFPVSTLETMYAGIPTIVSTRTGTKSRVRRVTDDFIVDPSPTSISEAVIDYFQTPIAETQAYSTAARNAVDDLTESEYTRDFETALASVV